MQKQLLKSILISLALLFIPAATALAAELDPNDTEVAATVNNSKITLGELDAMIMANPQFELMKAQLESNEERLEQVRSMVLESMIDRALLLEAAKKSTAVSETAATTKLKELIDQNGGEAQLREELKKRNQNYEKFAENMKYDIMISDYINNEVGKAIRISEADSRAIYDENPQQFAQPAQVHARHILVKVAPDASPEDTSAAKKKITEVHNKVKKADESFEAVAKEVSECPSATRGGDLGFFVKEQMVAPFADAAFALTPGEISEPVKTDFGYHVIKLEERKEAQEATFENARPIIEQQLEAKAKSDAAQEKIKELRASAAIDIELGPKG